MPSYRGKIHWFWGDTNRPDYPLGNFHVPGATSELPGPGRARSAMSASTSSYFLDEKGFARPTAPIARRGADLDLGPGRARRPRGPRADVRRTTSKVRNMLEVYQHGLVEFHPEIAAVREGRPVPRRGDHPGDYPSGHAFLHTDRGVDYVYYASPYPLIRVPADPDGSATRRRSSRSPA